MYYCYSRCKRMSHKSILFSILIVWIFAAISSEHNTYHFYSDSVKKLNVNRRTNSTVALISDLRYGGCTSPCLVETRSCGGNIIYNMSEVNRVCSMCNQRQCTDIPHAYIPGETTHLNLSSNSIRILKNNSFQNISIFDCPNVE